MSFPISKPEPQQTLVETSFSGKCWLLARQDDGLGLQISQQLDEPEIVGRLLAQRVTNLEQAQRYLNPRLKDWLPDPSHLIDLDAAVERFVTAIGAGEAVGLIGDYDVDGATAASLLARYLQALGCKCVVRIPDRLRDGYGANQRLLGELATVGCRLIVCLDNGTSAFEPLQWAAENALQVIVIDHHAAEQDLPPALALVNPNRPDQSSPLGNLAAVGVTFVLLVALNRALRQSGFFQHHQEPNLLQWLDLVALGTVCDVVDLSGLNRAFVAQGLRVAAQNDNPGLRALQDVARIERIDDTYHFGFLLGPRINAGGRMGQSDLGYQLLMAESVDVARPIAEQLDQLNSERREIEKNHLNEAIQVIEKQLVTEAPIIVAAADGWHPGVIGIVASRLVERYHRPCFVIALDNETGRGSGRSVPGVNLGAIVQAARRQGILQHAGGHAMAAGLTVQRDRLEDFIAHLNALPIAVEQRDAPSPRSLQIDGELSPQAIGLPLVEKLEKLMPFGQGNAEPLFAVRHARIVDPAIVGDGHLRFRITGPSGGQSQAIAFRAVESGLADKIKSAQAPLMLAAKLRRNSFRGRQSANLHVLDAAPDQDG